MKNFIKILFSTFLLTVVFLSCKKDENKDFYLGGTPPVLSSNSANISLSYVNKDNPAATFTWTNPNYQFSTGISSQDVTYTLEIDTTGSNFTNPNKQSVAISKDLSITITQGVLNDYLLNQLVLVPGITHNIEIRVKSSLINNSVILISNVLKFVITPYAIPPKVTPPASGHLYLVGSATAGGWNNPVPVPSQEFTQVSPTLYQITVALIGGNEYLFLPVNGDWSHKYACKNTPAGTTLNTGGDFGYDWSDNFPGPTATGNYKIEADFQRGKFTVTKL